MNDNDIIRQRIAGRSACHCQGAGSQRDAGQRGDRPLGRLLITDKIKKRTLVLEEHARD